MIYSPIWLNMSETKTITKLYMTILFCYRVMDVISRFKQDYRTDKLKDTDPKHKQDSFKNISYWRKTTGMN